MAGSHSTAPLTLHTTPIVRSKRQTVCSLSRSLDSPTRRRFQVCLLACLAVPVVSKQQETLGRESGRSPRPRLTSAWKSQPPCRNGLRARERSLRSGLRPENRMGALSAPACFRPALPRTVAVEDRARTLSQPDFWRCRLCRGVGYGWLGWQIAMM
ncbi:hypothetical protein BU23DRAFT_69570 [Bimuria novae-zelandiae CBS 107.79]|uniref:Uncharacterized protein n=1 Tax=Bimuria novae-zelandiae CBS 107.79 TaxID=1447943 RepID=A0A6A5VEF6_9PLEO|nr:hypothetical protein BU23DRAFT_69570 [Bimuria novae-zelandiae CBS 107.79]